MPTEACAGAHNTSGGSREDIDAVARSPHRNRHRRERSASAPAEPCRGGFPDARGEDRGSLCARLHHRHLGAHRGGAACPSMGQSRHCGERAGRRDEHRCRQRGPCAGRRPHPPGRAALSALVQSPDLSRPRLRSDQVRSDHSAGQDSERPRHPQRPAGDDAAGVDRTREGPSREADLCLAGRRLHRPPFGRATRGARGHQDGARALSRRAAGANRRHRGARRYVLRHACNLGAVLSRRQAEAAGRCR